MLNIVKSLKINELPYLTLIKGSIYVKLKFPVFSGMSGILKNFQKIVKNRVRNCFFTSF